MAIVLITLQDAADGSINVDCVTEPFIVDMDNMTPAQMLGGQVLGLVHSQLHDPETKRIILAGADEMPLN